MLHEVVLYVCGAREIVEFSDDALLGKALDPFGGLEFEAAESPSLPVPRPVCS